MTQNFTIVVADDDEGHAVLVKRNLKLMGILNPIVHFSNGEEVVQFFTGLCSNSPEACENYLILLDIKMPRLDGIEVLEKLKSNKASGKIPVIMITTSDNPKEIARCHSMGCNNLINKPIDYQKLAVIIKGLGYTLEKEKKLSI